ncbi:MAG: polysaccharide biosynthesis tyrosine autokinase [Chloroflexi bacterium]|nr:polysaccharide biosynthesis tyrosine autokinase [Chloroflexota bacterium]
MELKNYAFLLWRWSWLIVLFTLAAGSAAYVTTQRTIFIYQATTTFVISQAPVYSATPEYYILATTDRLARTYAELMRKRPVLQEVIANLGLTTDPGSLAGNINVSVSRDTQLITLSVQDTDPQRAADIANEVVKVFSRQNVQIQSSRYTATKQSLEKELARVQADIDKTQASIDAMLNAVTPEKLGQQSTTPSPQGIPAPELLLPPEQKVIYDRLQTQTAQSRNNYAVLLKSYEDLRFAESQASNIINVIEEALPGTVINPRSLNRIYLPTIMGALLAIGLIFLIDYLDDTVKTTEEIESMTSSSILGVIAQISGQNPREMLVAAHNSRSPVTEAYRVLRANIEFSAVDRTIRTLLVASSGPSEGKSTTVANLAITMAQGGKQVILVDTDLRRPTLHKSFGLNNREGVTSALLQPDNDLSNYLIPAGIDNLRLLTSGPLPPNPAELLGSQRMVTLIQALQSQADIVLFDSPPVLSVVDASLLARICDVTLVVARSRSTRRVALRKMREQLLQSGAHLVGIVLNQVSASESYYYYNYYHYHDYSSAAGEKNQLGRGLLQRIPLISGFMTSRADRRNGHSAQPEPASLPEHPNST